MWWRSVVDREVFVVDRRLGVWPPLDDTLIACTVLWLLLPRIPLIDSEDARRWFSLLPLPTGKCFTSGMPCSRYCRSISFSCSIFSESLLKGLEKIPPDRYILRPLFFWLFKVLSWTVLKSSELSERRFSQDTMASRLDRQRSLWKYNKCIKRMCSSWWKQAVNAQKSKSSHFFSQTTGIGKRFMVEILLT